MTPWQKITVAVLFLGIIVTWFLWPSNSAQTISTDKLSARAREFIADQNRDGSGPWVNVDLDDEQTRSPVLESSTRVSPGCFSFELPFKSTHTTFEITDDSCIWRAKTLDPHGQMVVTRSEDKNLNENTGIVLRRRESGVYKESRLPSKVFQTVLLFRSPKTVNVFAQKENHLITITFSNLSNEAGITDTLIQTLVESVVLSP